MEYRKPWRSRFDLENDINGCHSALEMINEVITELLENEDGITKEQVSNILMGIEALGQLRFARLNDTFRQVLKLDEYNYPKDKQCEP